MMQGWYYVESLTGRRHNRVLTKSQELQPWTAVLTLLQFLAVRLDSIGPGKRGHIVADTLLPTQMFPRLPACATFVPDTNFVSGTQKMFLILFSNILCPQQMFPSLRSSRNIMGNNVSATMCPRLPRPYHVVAPLSFLRSISLASLFAIPISSHPDWTSLSTKDLSHGIKNTKNNLSNNILLIISIQFPYTSNLLIELTPVTNYKFKVEKFLLPV